MKIFSTLLVVALVSVGASAQNLEQGTIAVTGGLGMQLQSQKQTLNSSSINYSVFTNQVDAAYFFLDNLAIGMRGTNQITSFKSTSMQGKSATNILVPNLMYNLSISESLALRLSVGFAFGNGYSETENVVTSTFSQAGFEAKASLPIFDREYLSVDPFFVYRSSTVTDNSNFTYDLVDTLLGFSMSVYYSSVKK